MSNTIMVWFVIGFVLGLLVELRGKYFITSNKESGRGRYDITLKSLNSKEENAYKTEFVTEDYQSIHTYGFAFKGKEVLIEKGE